MTSLFCSLQATNRHFPQTVTGAYLSGVREASKITVLWRALRENSSDASTSIWMFYRTFWCFPWRTLVMREDWWFWPTITLVVYGVLEWRRFQVATLLCSRFDDVWLLGSGRWSSTYCVIFSAIIQTWLYRTESVQWDILFSVMEREHAFV